jgi:hypothetical protein
MLAIADLLFDRSINTAPDMSMNHPRPGIKRIDFLAICPSVVVMSLCTRESDTYNSSGFGHYPPDVDDIDEAYGQPMPSQGIAAAYL